MRGKFFVIVLAVCGLELACASPTVETEGDAIEEYLKSLNLPRDPDTLFDALYKFYRTDLSNKVSGDREADMVRKIRFLVALRNVDPNCTMSDDLRSTSGLLQTLDADWVDVEANTNLFNYLVAHYRKKLSQKCEATLLRQFQEAYNLIDDTTLNYARTFTQDLAESMIGYKWALKNPTARDDQVQVLNYESIFQQNKAHEAGEKIIANLRRLAASDEDVQGLKVGQYSRSAIDTVYRKYISEPCHVFTQSSPIQNASSKYLDYVRTIMPSLTRTIYVLNREIIIMRVCHSVDSHEDRFQSAIESFLAGRND